MIKRILMSSQIIRGALLSILGLAFGVSTLYADIHQFKYTPNDEGNMTATITCCTVGTDNNGETYWTRNSSTDFLEQSVTWTTQSYVYAFVEASSTFLYNQSYVYGTSTYTNLSFYSGSGHAPDKINTFLVDGRYISMYRYYTLSGLSIPNFEITVSGNTGTTTGARLYGFVPSNSGTAPAVSDQTTMYEYLASFFSNTTHRKSVV